jgi:PAS domain S-box-containing protein
MTDETAPARVEPLDFLAGGGEMGELMRSFDFSATPLGPVSKWPQSLRSAVNICLNTKFPVVLYWGPRLISLYNDAYIPVWGKKHPWALGQPFEVAWAEIWDVAGPLVKPVMETGEASWSNDILMVMQRHGYQEECYFTFSYGAVRDESGGVGGIFCAVQETTQRVLQERRLGLLQGLGGDPRSAAEGAAMAAKSLQERPDMPFALIYLVDETGARAKLTACAGVAARSPAAPEEIDLSASAAQAWPLGAVAASRRLHLVEKLDPALGELPARPWPEPAQSAAVLPLAKAGAAGLAGFLVLGINPRRAFDQAYARFFDLAGDRIGTLVASGRAYEEEKKRAEALAELDRAKTRFFSNVSHEFRTPLTLMLGPVEDMLEKSYTDLTPQTKGQLEVVHRNSLRLLKLVNTMLDFARIEAGRMQARYDAVDLAALTAELASNFRAACERAGLKLNIDCPPLPAGQTAYVDRDMWEKIVLNLVSNAFKYTLEGEIEVRLEAASGEARLSVRDTGVGIPAEEMPRMFERFYRVKDSRGRTHEGTGIGLALVQELARLHGGSVCVESTLNVGSRFTVILPLGAAHLDPQRVNAGAGLAVTETAARAFVEEAMRWLPGEQPADAEAVWAKAVRSDLPAHEPEQSGVRPRLIWADDNADMREYVARLLSDRFEVQAVADGQAALEAARANPPEVILSDVMMPRLDGFGLVRAMRAEPTLKTIPVILLSARAGEEARVEGVEAGADDYLIKPFSARELVARVDAHARMARFRREASESLRASESRLAGILRSMTDAFMSFDAEFRFTFANEPCERRMGSSRAELIGRNVWELFPDAVGNKAHQELQRAMAERVPVEYEVFYEPWQRWFYDKAFPTADGGLALISQDITERKRAEEELRDTDRRKDEFLAMLSHELRNPLAPISAVVQLLDRTGNDPGAQAAARDILKRQVRHIVRLVDDLLDLARINQGTISLKKREIALSEAIESAVETTRPQIEAAQHALEVKLPREPLAVHADPVRLSQVLANLLVNAARYTPPRGRIEVDTRAEGGDALITVRDTGRGIAPEQIERIFDMFTRGADPSSGGLGLGLWLSRKLIEMHGGTLEARSEGEGRGAEFTVRLRAVAASNQVAAPASTAALEALSRRVLIVDDNRDAAESLGMLLRSMGHEVSLAHDGRDGIEAALREAPEIILLDLNMPQLDGFGVIDHLRKNGRLNSMRVVALTGFGQERDRARVREAGFDAHLVKPVELEALRGVIDSRSSRAQ